MAKKFRRKVMLAIVEGTYGVDGNPLAANAIETVDVEISEFEGPQERMEVDRAALGNSEVLHTGIYTTLTFKVRAAGSGAAGTAPAWGPLMRMCAHSEVVTALTDAKYTPISSTEESGTLYFNMDGTLHKLLGARGNVKPNFTPGKIPYFDFTIWGLRVDASSAALPAADYTAFKTPFPVNDAFTPTFTLHTFAANLLAFSFDSAMKLTYRNVVGEESIQIVDRAPSGQVTIEEPALGTKDFHAIVKAHTTGALQLIHGTTAGNIIQIDMPKVQLLKPRYQDSDGIVGLQMDLNPLPNSSAGDDEWVITVK